MESRDSFEDYTVGEKLISPSRTITEADIVNFAMITGDWHPIHVNKVHAEESFFGQRIAHGMLTLALGGGLCMWMGPDTYAPKSFIAFLAMDQIRMKTPTFIGDTITWEGEVVEMEKVSKGRGIITYNCEIKKQTGEVCASYVHKILVGRQLDEGEAGEQS